MEPPKLLEICRLAAAESDLSRLLDLLARGASDLLAAERASIFLLDESKSELWSQVALGSDEILRFDARLGIAGTVALTDETLLVSDVAEDERFYPGMDERTGFRTRSILAAPLRSSSGEVLGVFEVLNKRIGTFGDADRGALEELARHAAIAITNAQRLHELTAQNARLRVAAEGRFSTESIVGTSPRVRKIVQLIDEIRGTAVSVLVTGETGTGKELIARAIHGSSPRASCAFVAINCASLPEELVESELFGIDKGVATGVGARAGRFEQADGGTLFLDEIGDLSAGAQAKILRALQERVVERVGGRTSIPVDVRIIAATNKDLEAQDDFRADLYYRLKVVHIQTPALREVAGDIALLAERFLERKCDELGRAPKTLSAGALRRLAAYAWPGNVRELENEMLRLAASVRRVEIREDDLSASVLRDASAATPGHRTLKDAVEELERTAIVEALEQSGGNKAKAAKSLGLSRQGLHNKIARYRI
jgi:Nif-specific regulatory protein